MTTTTTTTTVPRQGGAPPYDDLAAALRGSLIRPGHAEYDQARAVYNGMIDRRPAAVARCVDVTDVIACVNFARENGADPLRHLLGALAAFLVVGEPPEREQCEVALRDDIGVVTRAPQLGERRMLPRRRLDPVHPRVQREQRGSRHAVLQSGPRCSAEGPGTAWEPLVESTDVPTERKDLRPSEAERARHESQAALGS